MTEGLHYSKDLETGIIGACINEPEAIGRIYGMLSPDMFYVSDNQLIYKTIKEMYSGSRSIDMMTIAIEMMQKGYTLDGGNIPSELARLSRQIVSAAHLEAHAEHIVKLYQARRVSQITNGASDLTGDVRAGIIKLNEELTKILGIDSTKDWHSMSDMVYELIKHQEAIRDGSKKMVTTGIKAVDRINSGFSEGDMVVIGARPAVGKSAFLLKISTEMAKQGKTVGIISLEMNNNQVVARLASMDSGVSFRTIYSNLFYDENERDNFLKKVQSNDFINLPIYVSDKTKVDITAIKTKAIKLKNTHGCDVLLIDYLQLVSSDDSRSNREQEVAKISRGIKLLAMEMKIPIVVLVQLNRDITKRSEKDRYPKLSDIRESGSLEQDADIVMMLHRDWPIGLMTDENGNSTEYEADLLGVKWRNGQPFTMKLGFEPTRMRFYELDTNTPPKGFVPVKNIYEVEKQELPF